MRPHHKKYMRGLDDLSPAIFLLHTGEQHKFALDHIYAAYREAAII